MLCDSTSRCRARPSSTLTLAPRTDCTSVNVRGGGGDAAATSSCERSLKPRRSSYTSSRLAPLSHTLPPTRELLAVAASGGTCAVARCDDFGGGAGPM